MVKTKKIIGFILAIIATIGVCCLTACKKDEAKNADPKTTYSFAISKTEMTLESGQSEKLECRYGDKKIVFSSSDDNIATVAADGTVTAVNAGVAYITAKADGVEGAEKMCKVTVVKYEYRVEIDRDTTLTAIKGASLDFVATVYRGGEKSNLTVKFMVTPTAATIIDKNTARVTFSATGEYTVKAEYAGVYAVVTVKVTDSIA